MIKIDKIREENWIDSIQGYWGSASNDERIEVIKDKVNEIIEVLNSRKS